MTVGSRARCGVIALALGLSSGAGCAKDPTALRVVVDADAAVPPILIVRTSVAQADDPARNATAERSSNSDDDAGDRPGPFFFPLDLSLTVDPSFAGPVIVTVEGLDWDTRTVIASGSTAAIVEAHRTASASLTLTAAAAGRR
jgi:hypothetical protein